MTFCKTLVLVLLVMGLLPVAASAQSTYYVSLDGDDGNPGTKDQPFRTTFIALQSAEHGDTVYVRGGTYDYGGTLSLEEEGSEGQYLHLWAYPDEEVILDFEGGDNSDRGIEVEGTYWHLKNIVVQNAGDNGVHISGDHNIAEQVVVRYNGDSGLQLDSGAAQNLVLNVDSYENYDADNNGENADGFAPKFDVGPGNVFRGCRAYRNSDDGFDMWNQDEANGNGVTVEDSWSFENGYNRWDDPNFAGDGNGFKLGHGTGAHRLMRIVTWQNAKNGIDINGNETGVHVYNATGYDNGGDNFYFDQSEGDHILKNNISFQGETRIESDIESDHNTWNDGYEATASDFQSLDDSVAVGPRQPDGSLPETNFLHLTEGSSLIDAGAQVDGIAYNQDAPDLGAFETGTLLAADDPAGTSGELMLAQNYPNPFQKTTTLAYRLAQPAPVTLTVYDVMGRTVATLVDARQAAGPHEVQWQPEGLGSGFYFARLRAGTHQHLVKMVLAR